MTRATALLTFALTLAAHGAAAQAPNWPSERPPRPLAPRDVKFPPYAVRRLPNGLQVIAVSHHEQPAVSLRLIVRAGGSQDPPARPGVAYLAAALLDQGTTTRTAEQVASTIDSIGGLAGTGSGSDLSFVNAIVMKDSFDVALDLVSDLVRNPAFAPEEIERQRQQMLSGLKVSYDDPNYLAGVVFDRLVYGSHSYGRPDTGTPESIAAITRDDLLAFHKAWFGANNAILAIVGDISAEEAFAGAERAFGKWGPSERTPSKAGDVPSPSRRVIVVDRPGAVQTEIRVGHIAVPRRSPDYLALDLATKILGGEGGNRLHRVLRSERGLTYGASADINALLETGDIVAETDTESEKTGQTLRLMVDEFWRLQREPVDQRELMDAQAYLTGNFPLTIETPSDIALQILNAVFYGLDLNELQTFRERVSAITTEDIQRVTRQYLHPDRLSIVLVGDASVFAKQLPGAGFDKYELIPLPDLDLTSPDLRRRVAPGPEDSRKKVRHEGPAAQGSSRRVRREGFSADGPPLQVLDVGFFTARSTSQDAAVKALIERAVQAKGGLAKLRAIRTVRGEGTTAVLDEGGRRVAVKTAFSIRYPGAFRVDTQAPDGRLLTQVFDAGECWIQDARGTRAAVPQLANLLRGNVQRDAVALLLALADGKVSARNLVDEREDGRALPALEASGPGMAAVVLVFDPETSLIRKERYTADGATTEEAYSDYRAIDGVQVAFKAVVRRGGAVILERVLRSVELNVPLPPTLFTRPSSS